MEPGGSKPFHLNPIRLEPSSNSTIASSHGVNATATLPSSSSYRSRGTAPTTWSPDLLQYAWGQLRQAEREVSKKDRSLQGLAETFWIRVNELFGDDPRATGVSKVLIKRRLGKVRGEVIGWFTTPSIPSGHQSHSTTSFPLNEHSGYNGRGISHSPMWPHVVQFARDAEGKLAERILHEGGTAEEATETCREFVARVNKVVFGNTFASRQEAALQDIITSCQKQALQEWHLHPSDLQPKASQPPPSDNFIPYKVEPDNFVSYGSPGSRGPRPRNRAISAATSAPAPHTSANVWTMPSMLERTTFNGYNTKALGFAPDHPDPLGSSMPHHQPAQAQFTSVAPSNTSHYWSTGQGYPSSTAAPGPSSALYSRGYSTPSRGTQALSGPGVAPPTTASVSSNPGGRSSAQANRDAASAPSTSSHYHSTSYPPHG